MSEEESYAILHGHFLARGVGFAESQRQVAILKTQVANLEEEGQKLRDAFARQNASMEFRQETIKALRAQVAELQLALQMSQRSQEGVQDAWVAEQDKVFALEEQVEAALELYGKACAERDGHIVSLEDALAVSAELLLVYRDYYGTSITQVQHLQGCVLCPYDPTVKHSTCPDYPSE